MGPNSAKTIAQLRELSDDELIAQHDELIGQGPGVIVGVSYYVEELSRRRTEGAEGMTLTAERRMLALTWAIAALTLVNVVAVLYGVLS